MIQLSSRFALGSGCSVCPPSPFLPCSNNPASVVKWNQCQCIYEIVHCCSLECLKPVIFEKRSLHRVTFVFRFVNLSVIMSVFYLSKPKG